MLFYLSGELSVEYRYPITHVPDNLFPESIGSTTLASDIQKPLQPPPPSPIGTVTLCTLHSHCVNAVVVLSSVIFLDFFGNECGM